MADNSSTNSNSWTILAPEVKESGVESMGPLSEEQGELHVEPAFTKSTLSDTPTEKTHPADPPQVAPLESSEDAAALHSTTLKEDTGSSVPAPVETLTSLTPDSGEQGDASTSQPHTEVESFSDSYTHVSQSHLSTSFHGASYEEEGLSQGEETAELRKTPIDEYKPEEEANEDVGLRRRNVSVLNPVHHQEELEEEEEEEEQFRPPQREREGEGDLGFTLNKCIIGALILLGLGTIFYSGVLMDLDDEGHSDAKDLKYPEVKKEWLNPDAQGDVPGSVQHPEVLDKLAKENQQVSSLESPLQEQEASTQQQVEEDTKEGLRRQELEAETQRMRGELGKLPVIQKEYEQENERVKRESSERVSKELETLPAMQKELERLREKVTELTQSTVNLQAVTPSAGHEESPNSQERKEKKDKKSWAKERKEKDLSAEKKEWKKEKTVKVNEQEGKGKRTKDHKEWEKEEDKKGKNKGEGKSMKKDHKQESWKIDGEKRELKQRSGKREQKEDKRWEKEKHGAHVDKRREKREQGKEDKEWKQKSEHKDWKEDKEWKKGKQASRNDQEGKGRSEKKDWKEKRGGGDEKVRAASADEKHIDKGHKEKTRKSKKDYNDEKIERKEKEEKHQGGKEKNKRTEGRKEEKKDKNYQKEDKTSRKVKHDASHHSHSDQKHGKDHKHGNYWAHQREKIRHFYGSTEECTDVTVCAHAEGLAPVSQRDFVAFISGYLKRIHVHEEHTARIDELSNLINEFFTDGVFVHDQIPFSEFVEDVGDILEDMADDDDDDEDKELENEMKGFATEAMEKFVHGEKDLNVEERGGRGRRRMKG